MSHLKERAEKEESYEQLTQEQIDILYEEPEMVTTNALKAVLGYVPHDDSRICQFYDQATGGCFKGNACRLEHVQTQPAAASSDPNALSLHSTCTGEND
ncbi:MAG: hypothetical protein EOO01_18505 [Chitinophagaceae bacterium]|nr:MAG: hypothetical protein EOO01_18505 [Chitinophagaceae bacterium]